MSVLRRIPVLRSRSSKEVGFCLAIASVLIFAGDFLAVGFALLADPPHESLAAGAGLGGAMFIAYSVRWPAVVGQVRRGRDSEILLGVVTGLSFCGLIGSLLLPILMAAPQLLGWLARLGLCFSGISILFLGAFVAMLPLFAYDDSRIKHLNHDE